MDKIFGWIGDLFTKIWRLFKKILPYIMIALAVFFTFGGSLTLLGMVLEGYAAAVACIGISFLVAPEESVDVVTDVSAAIGTAAGAIVSGVAGGLAAGLFGNGGSWVLIGAIAVGAYFLLNKKEGNLNSYSTADELPEDNGPGAVDGDPVVMAALSGSSSDTLKGVMV